MPLDLLLTEEIGVGENSKEVCFSVTQQANGHPEKLLFTYSGGMHNPSMLSFLVTKNKNNGTAETFSEKENVVTYATDRDAAIRMAHDWAYFNMLRLCRAGDISEDRTRFGKYSLSSLTGLTF